MANLRFFSENSKKKMQKFEKPSNLPLLDYKTIPPHRICRSSPRQTSDTLARRPTHTASRPTPSLGVPTDLKSVVKKGSTYQTWGFVIPLIHKILQLELLILH